VILTSGILALLSPAAVASGPDLPREAFVTPLPWLLPESSLQGIARARLSLQEPEPFGGEDPGRVERTRSSLLLEIAGGLGDRVEGSARVGAQVTGGREGSGGAVATDLRLRLGYAFLKQASHSGALAAWLQAKVPTAPDKGGAGSDETDIGAGLSAGLRGKRFAFFGHAGLELLGNPLRNGAQDDVAVYGTGLWWPVRKAWSLTVEAEGHAFSRFGNSGARLRIGGRLGGQDRNGRDPVAALVIWRGLNEDSALWGVDLLISAARF
jgi:hypothetical protein